MTRNLTYFVADVHLGCDVLNPRDREARFVGFLKSLPPETESLYMLGDIWDFWYEYRDVVPKGYIRVFAAILDLIDRGVNVYFFSRQPRCLELLLLRVSRNEEAGAAIRHDHLR